MPSDELSDDAFSQAFTPFRIAGVTLPNRFIKTATYEGMCPEGKPAQALVEHHRRIAAGGVGMTTVAYAAVNPDGRTFAEQMVLDDAVVPVLRQLTDAVHGEGAAASIQLGHCGYFSKNPDVSHRRPLSASARFNPYGLGMGVPFARTMTADDLKNTAADYARAAHLAVDAGFDAIEIHMGHGYLLSQFLSPWTNRRKDAYGGSPENRLRFPLEVLARVRESVGPETAIVCKTNLDDGFAKGLHIDEAVAVAQALESNGADAIELSGGFTSRSALYLLRGGRPLKRMIAVEENRMQRIGMRVFGPLLVKAFPYEETFFLPLAERVRAAVRMPLILLGGIASRNAVAGAMAGGFELMALGRALIHDPDFVRHLQAGEVDVSGCTHCNECIVEMDVGGVRCVIQPQQMVKTPLEQWG